MQLSIAKPWRRRGDLPIYVGFSILVLGFAIATFWITRSVNPLRGDSAEYLYFDPSRTVGYPAFLEFIRIATHDVALAVPAQMAVLAASLLALGISFCRFIRHRRAAAAFQFLVIANVGMWFASAFLMTEAISTALVALWCAQLLRMIDKPRPGHLIGLVAISCIANMVRPSLIALFFGTIFYASLVIPRPKRARATAIATGACIAALAATPIAQEIVHGTARTTSPFARGVLQHTLYCAPRAIPNDADSRFVEANAKPVRRYIDTAPPSIQEQFRREYSTPLRFGLIIPVLGERHHLATRSQTDPYLARIAEERVRANPSCYARSVANEYFRLAVFDTDPSAEDARNVNLFATQHPPVEVPQIPLLPGDDRMARRAALEVHHNPAGLNPLRQQLHVVGGVPLIALLPFRLLYAAAAFLGGIAPLLVLIRRPQMDDRQSLYPALAAVGLTLHSTLVITAIVEIGFYRYLVPCWPLVCTLIALGVIAIRRALRRRRPGLDPLKSLTLAASGSRPDKHEIATSG